MLVSTALQACKGSMAMLFHLEDGGSVSINGIFHDSLPLLHAFLAVLLQVCVPLLECSKVHLLTLPNQHVVLLHISDQNENSSYDNHPMK